MNVTAKNTGKQTEENGMNNDHDYEIYCTCGIDGSREDAKGNIIISRETLKQIIEVCDACPDVKLQAGDTAEAERLFEAVMALCMNPELCAYFNEHQRRLDGLKPLNQDRVL